MMRHAAKDDNGNTRSMKPIFLILTVLLHASVTIVQATEPPFEAGTGRSDITPTRAELNELPSGFTEKPLFPDGVTQPLWAKALATRVGDRTLLLITVDLGSTPLWLSDAMREELSKKCSLPRGASYHMMTPGITPPGLSGCGC